MSLTLFSCVGPEAIAKTIPEGDALFSGIARDGVIKFCGKRSTSETFRL